MMSGESSRSSIYNKAKRSSKSAHVRRLMVDVEKAGGRMMLGEVESSQSRQVIATGERKARSLEDSKNEQSHNNIYTGRASVVAARGINTSNLTRLTMPDWV